MRRWNIPLITMYICLATAVCPLRAQVAIDGDLQDSLWRRVSPATLSPRQPGVPASIGGEIRAVVRGDYLYLSAHLPEPGGRVVARSIGFDPVWEGGGEARGISDPERVTYGTQDGEDYVRFIIRAANENDWLLQVGPLGAYSVKWRGAGKHDWNAADPKKCDRFLVAAKSNSDSWNVEAALPLDQLGSPGLGGIQVSVERNRAERPGAPNEWWRWPEHQPAAPVTSLPAEGAQKPVYRPAGLGNNEEPIAVGYRPSLPEMGTKWTDAGWQDVPTWTLRRNEASARLPQFPTQVKMMRSGKTVGL